MNANLSVEQQQKLQQFKEMFGIRENAQALAILEEARWNSEQAMDIYFARQQAMEVEGILAIESDDDVMEDSDDDVIIIDDDEMAPSRGESLLPIRYASFASATEKFSENFARRHQFNVRWHTGELESALQVAFNGQNAEDLRPLALYMNHERNAESVVFSNMVLGNAIVRRRLEEMFTCVPWDITERTDLEYLTNTLDRCNLASVATFIRRKCVGEDEIPVLILIGQRGSGYEKLSWLSNYDTAEECDSALFVTFDNYVRVQKERREQEVRRAIRDQQEAEYQKSLAADLARMKKVREEEEKKRLKQERAAQKAEEKRIAEQKEQLRRAEVASALPSEPSADENVVTIKFRLPENRQSTRRFRKSEPLRTMLNFVSSLGCSTDEYKILNSDFPKKNVVEHFDVDRTFNDVKWPLREQIFVEELN